MLELIQFYNGWCWPIRGRLRAIAETEKERCVVTRSHASTMYGNLMANNQAFPAPENIPRSVTGCSGLWDPKPAAKTPTISHTYLGCMQGARSYVKSSHLLCNRLGLIHDEVSIDIVRCTPASSLGKQSESLADLPPLSQTPVLGT